MERVGVILGVRMVQVPTGERSTQKKGILQTV